MSQRIQRPEIVVITGASGGVRRAIARVFGKRGEHTASDDRSTECIYAVRVAEHKTMIANVVAGVAGLTAAAWILTARHGG